MGNFENNDGGGEYLKSGEITKSDINNLDNVLNNKDSLNQLKDKFLENKDIFDRFKKGYLKTFDKMRHGDTTFNDKEKQIILKSFVAFFPNDKNLIADLLPKSIESNEQLKNKNTLSLNEFVAIENLKHYLIPLPQELVNNGIISQELIFDKKILNIILNLTQQLMQGNKEQKDIFDKFIQSGLGKQIWEDSLKFWDFENIYGQIKTDVKKEDINYLIGLNGKYEEYITNLDNLNKELNRIFLEQNHESWHIN